MASRPGVYTLDIIAASDEGIDRTEFTVTIAGSVPIPDPVIPIPPTPNPSPIIPPEKDKNGLATLAYTQCISNLSPADKAIVSAIADGYASVSSQIAAGTITTISEMNAKILEKNRAATGDQKDRFGQGLIVPLAKRVGGLGMKSPADYKEVFDEISFGLYLFAK